ncbi:MAG: rhomboid family intramembrane serine protease [Anaerolineae bacterium]
MIPIGDHNWRRRVPTATILLVLANVAVFLYQSLLPPQSREQFLLQAAMIPRALVSSPSVAVAGTLLTSMFLHDGLLHIAGNMLYLGIFGDNVEETLGTLGFLAFYIAGGIGAGLAHVITHPFSTTPTVGASGAIAAVLGAYFALFPTNRVRTLLVLGWFIRFVDLPAFLVLGMWFVLQLINGVLSLGMAASGGVAWFAHLGGFVFGLVIGGLLRHRRPAHPFRQGW